MIARYTAVEMKNHWSDESRFQKWFEVELAVLKILEKKKWIPNGVSRKIGKAKVRVNRILEIEKDLHHDVIAFTHSISEQVKDVGRFFHYGLTSSDVVDTAFSLLLLDALEKIEDKLNELKKVCLVSARKYKKLPCIGRTHGIHAEPTSFGLKFLGWYCEFQRQHKRLVEAKEEIAFGKLSGAVGSYGKITPEIEKQALALLGLKPEPVATQVLPRDRHSHVFSVIAGIGASIERVSVELRHLQRTEVGEVEEFFGREQKGSSAMPHKKNPISAENLSGCARLLRGYSVAALENVALWHERDISHSSVERVIAPDATILLHYMLGRLTKVLKNLKVNSAVVAENLKKTQGAVFSGHVLLAFVQKGMTREDAYRLVQRSAHEALLKRKPMMDLLWSDQLVREHFSHKELKATFDVKNYLKNVDRMYERVSKHATASKLSN
ncbi:MAG: adenylosuccinate lyase [Bacteriovoracia bacterium]